MSTAEKKATKSNDGFFFYTSMVYAAALIGLANLLGVMTEDLDVSTAFWFALVFHGFIFHVATARMRDNKLRRLERELDALQPSPTAA